MHDEMIPHVTSKGEFIEWVTRAEVHERQLVHRSIQVLIFHPDGRLLVQLRHREKQTFPHYWDISCSGHVELVDHPHGDGTRDQEAFWSSATREVHEELGIEPELRLVGTFEPIPDMNYEYSAVFKGICEGPFVIQEEELEEVRWVTQDELMSLGKITNTIRWLMDANVIWP